MKLFHLATLSSSSSTQKFDCKLLVGRLKLLITFLAGAQLQLKQLKGKQKKV
jgi:hypothetical protein